MFDITAFRNPPSIYRGTDFWMLNDALKEDDIRFQLHEMKKQGIGSFIARTYIGLKSDYPGPEFKQKLKLIVQVAGELGLKLYLQAGYMPEAVLGLPHEFALISLRIMSRSEAAGKDIVQCFRDYAIYADHSETLLDMFNPEACRFYLKLSYEDMWCDFKSEFGKTIESIWVDEPSYCDSTLPWSPAIAAEFKKHWGYEIASEAHKLFFDVDNYKTVRYHYWIVVQDLLRRAYFEQVQAWCHRNNIKFSGHLMLEDTMYLQLTHAAAVMPYYKYFDIPGIDCLMANMEFNDMPIRDRWMKPEPRPELYTTALQCSSAANQAGQKHILAEMYGVSSENLTMRDQKHLYDNFAVFGINHRSVHGLFYSLRGRGKRAYPPHVNYYQPYWKDYKMMTDYCARSSYFISCGQAVKPIMIIHPLSSAACEYRTKGSPDGISASLTIRDKNFLALQTDLLHAGCDIELADEATIAMWGKVDQDHDGPYFQVGKMKYRVIVLPEMEVIAKTTLDLLQKFIMIGGKICVSGNVPVLVDGYPSEEAKEVLVKTEIYASHSDLRDELLKIPKDYSVTCDYDAASILVNHRKDEKYDYFFIFNKDCSHSKNITLTLPVHVSAHLLEADGTMNPHPVTSADHGSILDLTVPEGGSIMVLADRTVEEITNKSEVSSPLLSLELKDLWSLKNLDPNVLLLEFCRFRKEGETEWSKRYPVSAVDEILKDLQYVGKLEQEFCFSSDIEISDAKLVLESPDMHRIFLDDIEMQNTSDGYFQAREFETVKLPKISPGSHKIKLLRDYVPLSKARSAITSLFEHQRGAELEPIAVIGNFGVYSHQKPVFNAVGIRMDHHFHLGRLPVQMKKELVNQGFPFYSGSLKLRQVFDINPSLAEQPLNLVLSGVNACVIKVCIDFEYMGCLAWHPYRLKLGTLNSGRHEIELEITNTIRNYLGPWHRPKGEYGECWGGYAHPNLSWQGAEDEYTRQPIPNWYEYREPDTSAWTEDYMFIPFGIHRAIIQG